MRHTILLLFSIILAVRGQVDEYIAPGGSRYDINELSKKTFTIESGESTFYVRINASPSYSCGNEQSVCERTLGGSKALGKYTTQVFSPQITGDDSMGFVVDMYEGQECQPGENYSTTIFFSCSLTETINKLSSEEDCNVWFTIGTPLACPTNRRLNCAHTLNGHTYDLTPLGMISMSYDDAATNQIVKVRICDRHPNCGDDEDACVLNQNKENVRTLGHASTEIVELDSSALKISYPDFNTNIFLFCANDDKNEITDVEIEDSTTIFITTPHACENPGPGPGPGPEPEPEPEPEPIPDELEDKIHYTSSNGFLYDMTYFNQNDVEAKLPDGTKIFLRVGAEPSGMSCGEGRSVCMETPESGILSAGTVQSQQFEDSADQSMGVDVKYSNGNTCSEENDVKVRYHSSIEFFCDEEVETYSIIDASMNGCALVIFVTSKYACSSNADELDCVYNAPDGRKFDLTELQDKVFHAKVEETNDDFYYAVCGTNSQCGAGIGACVVKNGVKTQAGLLSSSKLSIDENLLRLKYTFTEENVDKHTSIYFECDKDSTTFETEDIVVMDNSYIVSTKSKQGCPVSSCSLGPHDFEPLSGITYSSPIEGGDGTVEFRICDALDTTTGSAVEVALQNARIITGKLATQKISNFEPTVALIAYSDGDMSAENTPGESSIYLGCDETTEFKIDKAQFNKQSNVVSVYANTKYMCDIKPEDSSSSSAWTEPAKSFPWWILIIGIILLIIVGYFCFMIIYNLLNGKTGIEVVPHSQILCCCLQPKAPKYVALPT